MTVAVNVRGKPLFVSEACLEMGLQLEPSKNQPSCPAALPLEEQPAGQAELPFMA